MFRGFLILKASESVDFGHFLRVTCTKASVVSLDDHRIESSGTERGVAVSSVMPMSEYYLSVHYSISALLAMRDSRIITPNYPHTSLFHILLRVRLRTSLRFK